MEKMPTIADRSYRFSLGIIKFTNSLPNKRAAWVISDQLIRSACSIGANCIEARASSSRLEYKKFYEIALKSGNETVYWLRLLKDSGLAGIAEVDPLLAETLELCRILGKSVTLKSRKF